MAVSYNVKVGIDIGSVPVNGCNCWTVVLFVASAGMVSVSRWCGVGVVGLHTAGWFEYVCVGGFIDVFFMRFR